MAKEAGELQVMIKALEKWVDNNKLEVNVDKINLWYLRIETGEKAERNGNVRERMLK